MRSFALACLAIVLAGCAYDWDVGPRVEAGVDAKAPLDSTAPADTAPAPDTAVVDTAPEAVDCAALLAEVATRRVAAKKCVSTALVCTTEVVDECGCKSITEQADAETNLYADAAKRARDAGCKSPSCGTTCPEPRPNYCLLADGGGTSCAGP
ncbi:MAG: hypothetical protein HYV09_00465 [Deltaproteobacteria bacterium]|nr:hypothetical protein [Deltaproteobacteria bacterium]